MSDDPVVAPDGAAAAAPADAPPWLATPLPPPRGGTPIYSTTTRSPPERPKVSGVYISSALAGGTTKSPGVVARAT